MRGDAVWERGSLLVLPELDVVCADIEGARVVGAGGWEKECCPDGVGASSSSSESRPCDGSRYGGGGSPTGFDVGRRNGSDA